MSHFSKGPPFGPRPLRLRCHVPGGPLEVSPDHGIYDQIVGSETQLETFSEPPTAPIVAK